MADDTSEPVANQEGAGPSVDDIMSVIGLTSEGEQDISVPDTEVSEPGAPTTDSAKLSEDTVVEDDAAKEESTDSDTTADGDTAEPEKTDDALDDAYSVLLRDGWKVGQLTKLARRDVLELAKHRAKVQRDTDEAFAERDRLQKLSKESTQVSEESATGSDTAAPVPALPSLADLSTVARPFAEAIENAEDPSDALAAFTQHVVETQTRDVQDRVTKLDEQTRVLSAFLEDMVWDRARGELSERIPQLSQDSDFERVKEAALGLGQERHKDKTGIPRLVALLEDAAKLELPDAPSKKEVERQERIDRQKEQGNPAKAGVSKGKSKPKTDEQIVDSKIAMAMQGHTAEEIIRAHGGTSK